MHDAALGSETRPTPAASKSGRDEEKGKERESKWKKEEGEGGQLCTPTDVWKEALNQPHVHTSSVSWLGNAFSTRKPAASAAQRGR